MFYYRNLVDTEIETRTSTQEAEQEEKDRLEEAKSVYEMATNDLITERKRRIESADSLLKLCMEGNGENPTNIDDVMFHTWLANRLRAQEEYFNFNVEKFRALLKKVMSNNFTDLRNHFQENFEKGRLADSPQARGKFVAARLMESVWSEESEKRIKKCKINEPRAE